MPSDQNQNSSERFTLRVAGLILPDEQKTALEKAADDLADRVDAAGCLDPLDAEPAVLFDSRS